MRVLTRNDVKALVSMPEAIGLMKVAFADLARGDAQSPLRTPVHVEGGVSLVMPAYVPSAQALGLKVVSVFSENKRRGLPTITSLVTILDHETGQPLAVMDGGYLTALRTGAVSGAATDLLARPNSRNLTIIGTGAQAVTQMAAVCAVRPIETVHVVARSEEGGERFLEAVSKDWPDLTSLVIITRDIGGSVAQADIICTATSSSTPVFSDEHVLPGTHINGVGSFTPSMQEVPAETVVRATVVVDQIEPALEEAGDLIIPLEAGLITRDHLRRELGHLVLGDVEGRTSDDEVTFFKSVGNAVQDLVTARAAYEAAEKLGIGQEVSLL